jgi:hypothetical protein
VNAGVDSVVDANRDLSRALRERSAEGVRYCCGRGIDDARVAFECVAQAVVIVWPESPGVVECDEVPVGVVA